MTDQEENHNTEQESKPFRAYPLNRFIAILFVLGMYVFIFLKILFLE
jgi:hypothetical protein